MKKDAGAYVREVETGVLIRPGATGIDYSDGVQLEPRLLQILQAAKDLGTFSPELAAAITDWPSEAHLSVARANLLRPFGIGPEHRVLELGAGCGALTRYLGESGARVDAVEGSHARACCAAARVRDLGNVDVYCEDIEKFEAVDRYDVVTLVGVIEYSRLYSDGADPVVGYLQRARELLRPGGTLLVAIENQIGLKYLAGCEEDHLGVPFAGLTDLYGRRSPVTFGKRELAEKLLAAGFTALAWYYPFPDYKVPTIVVSDAAAAAGSPFSVGDLLYGELSRDYSGNDLRCFDESAAWPVLQRNGVLGDFANSFLVVAGAAAASLLAPGGSWLAEKYTSTRTARFATITRFSMTATNAVVVDKLPLPLDRPDRISPAPELPLLHRRRRADYVSGRIFARQFSRAVAQGEGIAKLASILTPWVSLLLNEARRTHPDSTSTPWSALTIPGDRVDCVPFNLLEEPDGTLRIIDDEFAIDGEIPLPWVILRGVVHTANKCLGQGALLGLSNAGLVRELLPCLGLPDIADWSQYCELENRLVRTLLAPWPGRNDSAPFDTLMEQPVAVRRSTLAALARGEAEGTGARSAVDALRNWIGSLLEGLHAGSRLVSMGDEASLRAVASGLAAVLRQPSEADNWFAALRLVEARLVEVANDGRELARERALQSVAAEREWSAAMVAELRMRIADLRSGETALMAQVGSLESALSSQSVAATQTIESLRSTFDATRLAQDESERLVLAQQEAHAERLNRLVLELEAARSSFDNEIAAREAAFEAQRVAHVRHLEELTAGAGAVRVALEGEIASRNAELEALREAHARQLRDLAAEADATRRAFETSLGQTAVMTQALQERVSAAEAAARGADEHAVRLAARMEQIAGSRWYRLFGPRVDPEFGAPAGSADSGRGRSRRALFAALRSVYRGLPVPTNLRAEAKNAFYERFGFLFRQFPNYQIWHAQRSTAGRLLGSGPQAIPGDAKSGAQSRTAVPAGCAISVVVPAYGKAEMTRRAIACLAAAGEPQPLEVLVVDDGSPSPLAESLADLAHVRVIRNDANMGFVGACNRGAAEATGTHLLFLNNDTEVQPGALAAMLAAYSELPEAGLVGCKLVFPDGRLQEAGAYLKVDGTAEMIGLWDDADRPRYGFAREVGYCSGACFLIERSLFEELGGFDPEFAPAYCEDSDLCYRVRRAGRRVYYEPRAVVIHQLSASMQDSRIDKQAVVATNQQKFLQRWQSTLLAEDAQLRAIAFYLPQYHPIPENDRWWGKGFTEWTNVARGRSQFPGHSQPNLPTDLGFYDLRLPEVRERQADLARASGIHGFCYYSYWFGGTRLLNAPLDAVIASGKPDFPFCICWANENWTRRWDGLESEILIGQHHSPEDDLAFFDSLLPALRDPRYIRIDGRPLLLVYRPGLLPEPAATAQRWRDRARNSGIGEIYLATIQSFFHLDPRGPYAYGFDAAVEFPPHSLAVEAVPQPRGLPGSKFDGKAYDYVATREQFLGREMPGYPLFRCAMPRWDNTARRGSEAGVFLGSTPAEYGEWLRRAIEYTKSAYFGDERLVFINAWNEWGEGNFLEPDQEHGHAYLDATRRVLVGRERR